MAEFESRPAETTREVFLSTAEAHFAEHGFDGARVDSIAHTAGHSKNLIFRHFGDKLGLYKAVLEQTDRKLGELQARMFGPLIDNPSLAADAHQFKTFLEMLVTVTFEYLLDHPRFLRIFTWEMAQGWQTYAQLLSPIDSDEVSRFEMIFQTAWNAGLLQSVFTPVIQLTLILQVCQSYIAFLPLYQNMLPGSDVSSASMLAGAKEHLVTLVVSGMLATPNPPRQEHGVSPSS